MELAHQCTEGALSIIDGSLWLDEDKCIQCERCLNGNLLKGACIVRNYSSRKNSYIITNEEEKSMKEFKQNNYIYKSLKYGWTMERMDGYLIIILN